MFPESERANANAAFGKLMEDVDMTLVTKNRDTFTQHIAKFRRELTAPSTGTTSKAGTSSTPTSSAMMGMAF